MSAGDVTLPDRLDEQAQDCLELGLKAAAQLNIDASNRICELEQEVLRLRSKIVIHRGERTSTVGGIHNCDRRLWEVLGDLPLNEIKGDM